MFKENQLVLRHGQLKSQCLKDYFGNRSTYKMFNKGSSISFEYHNVLAEAYGNMPKFSIFDLVRTKIAPWNLKDMFFLVTLQSFNPGKSFFEKEAYEQGSWFYEGLVYKLKDDLMIYETTIPLISERNLESIVNDKQKEESL